jgi:protein-S-isoprenylcysteine O-methyltransferase Ste14
MNLAGVAVRECRGLWSVLGDPIVDRVIATVASVPFGYLIYHRLIVEGADLPRIAMATNYGLLIATMVIRRPPVRVTTNPLYWATAFVATYWVFMTLGLLERGSPIAPTFLTHGLALIGLAIAVIARVNLGRNIGFVPAQRELVTSGIYGLLRHPIYAALFVNLIGVALRSCSTRNLLIIGVGASLFVVKTFMEEDFLSQDPAYARYMSRVRYRWIPFVA